MHPNRFRTFVLLFFFAVIGGSFPSVINAQKWWNPYWINSAKPLTAIASVVTDTSNKKFEFSEQGIIPPNFTYSGQYKRPYDGFIEDQLEVILSHSPKRSAWVHYSQIDKVLFSRSNLPGTSNLHIAVQLEAGSSMEGMASDNLIGFRGLVDFLQFGLPLERISMVQFTSFRTEGKSMDRQSAAAAWQKQHSALSYKCPALVEDDGRITNAKVLYIVDHYLSDTARQMIYPGPLWNDYLLDKSIRISKDSGGQREFPFNSLESFVITGKLHSERPEVTVKSWDGSIVSGGLDMLQSVVQKRPGMTVGPSKEIKGSLDPEDAVQWWTPYGFETVSLLPLRRISVTFLQKCW
jgi:hypothetical protein